MYYNRLLFLNWSFSTDDGGIEMQILASSTMIDPISRTSIENNNNNSNDMSQANSVISIDYPAERLTSTMGGFILCEITKKKI